MPKKNRFVELNLEAWKPLPENQRLDAYYHHRELFGNQRQSVEKQEDPIKNEIQAESLGELPPTAWMTIEERNLLRDVGQSEALPESPQPQAEEETLPEASSPTISESKELKPKYRRKRSSKQQEEVQRVAPAAKLEDSLRPQSAPARLGKQAPVRIYANHFREEVRGAPEPPRLVCSTKACERRGFTNNIFSDVITRQRGKENTVEKHASSVRKKVSRSAGAARVVPVVDDDLSEMVERRVITFSGTISAHLESATPWSTVRYTLDGTAVRQNSPMYLQLLEISDSVVLRARSSKRGWLSDEIEVELVKRVDTRCIKQCILRASQNANFTKLLNYTRHEHAKLDTTKTPRELNAASLMSAVRRRNVVVVRKLLQAGVDPNQKVEGRSPLVEACRVGDVIIVSLLLAYKADASGHVALHEACAIGAHRCCQLLLDAGAHCDAADHEGRSALHVACAVGSPGCVDVLLKAGADIEKVTPQGEQPLHTACRSFANPANAQCQAPDYSACLRNLIAGGAALNAKFNGQRPIQYAAQSDAAGHLVQTLLDAGAKPLLPAKAASQMKEATRPATSKKQQRPSYGPGNKGRSISRKKGRI